jgi:hypothetical protein
MSPTRAVLLGHRYVSLPALAIIAGVALIGTVIFGRDALGKSLLVGIVPGWLWWSYAVPRWRDWVERQGLDEASIYSKAVYFGLVFPKGFFLEQTEFRRSDGTKGWRTRPLP